ncbi:MAG: flagellar assembly protein FliW [Armatimonadetes bacterium]|nr:flagellar assembly protein FliW [Armatimonadota bacterium]
MMETKTKLVGTRFGELEFAETDVFTFEGGLVGLEGWRTFVVLNHKEDSPFRWLQSTEDPRLALLVVEPGQFVKDYEFDVSDAVAKRIEMTDSAQAAVYTTVSIPAGKPRDMTLNLAGPILVNVLSRKGIQLVLDDPGYTVKHRAFPEADEPSKAA